MAFARVASLTRTVPMGNMRDLLVRGGIPFTELMEPPDSTASATDVEEDEEEEVPFPPRSHIQGTDWEDHFEYLQ